MNLSSKLGTTDSFIGQILVGYIDSFLGHLLLGRVLQAYVASTTDSPTTSDTVTRVFVGTRTVSDSPSPSELVTRIFVGTRTTTDHPVTSESVSRVFVGTRTATDSPTTSESATRILVGTRTTIDSPTTSESVSRLFDGTRTATDSPTTSESVTASQVINRTTTDSPTTSESATRLFDGTRTTTDSPTTSESATASQVINRTTTNSPTTSESVQVAVFYVQTGLDTPTISENLTTQKILLKQISQSLVLSQSTVIFKAYENTQPIVITQDAAYFAIFNRPLTQTLTITQNVLSLKIIPITVTNTLNIYHTSTTNLIYKPTNILIISQDINRDVFRNKQTQNSLHITHNVNVQLILNRNLTSQLIFQNEHPVLDGAGGIINIPNLIVLKGGFTLSDCCSVARLSTTFQSATRTIVLPNPEFNDTENLIASVSVKRTITGQTYSYVKKSNNRKLKYKFLITQRKAFELEHFLTDYLGDRITMINWKSETWSGYFLTDPAEIISDMHGGPCIGDLYEINLEYQGVKL